MSTQARIMVQSRCVFISLLFRIASSMDRLQLHLFVFSKVNVTLLRQFLGFYCPSKVGLWLNHDAVLYHYYLGSFLDWITFSYICSCSVRYMLHYLDSFLGLYCPHKLGLWFNHDAFLYHYYLGLHQAWIAFSYISSCSVR